MRKHRHPFCNNLTPPPFLKRALWLSIIQSLPSIASCRIFQCEIVFCRIVFCRPTFDDHYLHSTYLGTLVSILYYARACWYFDLQTNEAWFYLMDCYNSHLFRLAPRAFEGERRPSVPYWIKKKYAFFRCTEWPPLSRAKNTKNRNCVGCVCS